MKKLKIVILVLITLISFFPFYTMFMMSTRYSEDIFKGIKYVLTPGDYLFKNISTALEFNFIRSYWNSFVVTMLSTSIGLFTSAIAGFAFAKYEFKFKKLLFTLILMLMMVPGHIGLVGYVLEMRLLGLNNTLLPLILCSTTSIFGVFFMTQNIKMSIPDEILESARIDGSGDFGVFFKIVMPSLKPMLTTLGMLLFLWSWNSYMLPMIIINKQELYTIPLVITTLGNLWRVDYGARLAALMLSIIPVLVIFVIGSKTFIKGITAGAVKG